MTLPQRAFAAVIFDLDQTLVDSRRSLYDAWTAWAKEYGVAADEGTDWNGKSTEAIVRELVDADRADEAIETIDALEVSNAGSCTALPGAAEALAALPAERVAVATSGTTPVARARLTAAGLPIPGVLVTATDVERAKPDPALFLAAAERLGVDPADCLVVEDATAGIQAARAAGAAALGVLVSTPGLEADATVPDLGHVLWRPGPDGVRVELR